MKYFISHYLLPAALVAALTTTMPTAQASSVEAVAGVDSFALAENEAGYIAEYDATAQIETYAEIVYRSYIDALATALQMQTAIDEFLAAPTPQSLHRAQTAWINARLPYSRTEAFRFYQGPIDYVDANGGGEGPEGRINGWPLNEAYIDSVRGNPAAGLVNANFALSADALIERNQQTDEANVSTGWHAIEFLLWGQDFNPRGPGQRAAADFAATAPGGERRAEYLRIITNLLVNDLIGLADEWAPNRPDNYRFAFTHMPQREALGRILTGMAMLSAFEMGSERMGVALDSGDQEDEQSCFSDNTRNDFVGNQLGIAALYFGVYKDFTGEGLNRLAAAAAPAEARRSTNAVIAANEAVNLLHAPFDLALTQTPSTARNNAESAVTALHNQGEQLQRLGQALGARVIIGE